jgi:beta-lactamase regulating signal transducer with metallopeptidase domain
MTSEVLAALLRVNLVGAVAVLAVLAVRIPIRRLFGPEIAYRLWAAPPLAALATLLPARVVIVDRMAAPTLAGAGHDYSLPALAAWLAGVGLAIGAVAWAQARFTTAVLGGAGGPAVVGVVNPRIVMPADDGSYSDAERELIRAHERQHIVRGDPRAGALAVLFQTLFWFNPLVHLAAHVMRLDQELACDAAVLRRRPRDRALYAKTLLKTQLAAQPLPFGCYWPARGPHPLEVRVGLLKAPVRYEGLIGPLLVATAVTCSALAAWSAQPPTPRSDHVRESWEFQFKDRGPTMSVLLIDDWAAYTNRQR